MESRYLLKDDQSVVFIGLTCLDIINSLEAYPIEDQGHRCLDCKWQRGGNASNSATVYSLLGGSVRFFGTLADCNSLTFIENDFRKYNISLDQCPRIQNATCPLSVVILNQSSGSRTVLHTNKDLRELTLQDLKDHIDLETTDIGWFHFEGRDNASNIFKMISSIKAFNDRRYDAQQKLSTGNGSKSSDCKIISLEAEKLRFARGMDEFNLWELPDVLFVSKDFSNSQGYMNMKDAAQGYFKKIKQGAIVVCAWSDEGAAAMSEEEGLVISPAFPPSDVVDTCGAGDTFNASIIRALSTGKTLQDSLLFACRIAGAKCGFPGYDGVEKIVDK